MYGFLFERVDAMHAKVRKLEDVGTDVDDCACQHALAASLGLRRVSGTQSSTSLVTLTIKWKVGNVMHAQTRVSVKARDQPRVNKTAADRFPRISKNRRFTGIANL
jgi:hypothetical protein